MMDETFVVNQMKEDVCFVSENFSEELTVESKRDECSRKNRIEYILPDFTTFKRGFVNKNTSEQPHGQQTIQISTERFVIPELLFNPSDVGIHQMGIPEAVIDALKDCPEFAHAFLLSNIVVVGGSSIFPGFSARLRKDLGKLVPDHLYIQVITPEDPVTYSWNGGKKFASAPEFDDSILRRQDYEERGFQYSLCKLEE